MALFPLLTSGGAEAPTDTSSLCAVVTQAPPPLYSVLLTYLTTVGLPALPAPEAETLLGKVLAWPPDAEACVRWLPLVASAVSARRLTPLAAAVAAGAHGIVYRCLQPAAWHDRWLALVQLVLGHPSALSPRLFPVGAVLEAVQRALVSVSAARGSGCVFMECAQRALLLVRACPACPTAPRPACPRVP